MKLLKNLFKNQAKIEQKESNLSNPQNWFMDILGGNKTTSGERITKEGALNISAVYACVNIRANTIAKMPIHLYQKVENGKKRIMDDDIAYLLETRPNQYMTPFILKHTLSTHIDLWGNAYIWIERKKGQAIALWLLSPDSTQTFLDIETGILWYLTSINGKPYKFRNEEILHFKALSCDGINGKSRISIARETLGNMQSGNKLLGKFYANGTTAKGILTFPTELSPEAKNQIRKAWEEVNSGLDNAGKVGVVDRGLTYQQIGMSFEDAQFIQLSKFGVEEIARIFNVPLHMINSLDRSTFNNIQQQSLDFISNSIQPTLTDIEEEMNYKLFSEVKKKQGYYVKFNMEAALRADIESRANFYEKMLNNGIYCINDVLEKEDKNTIGDIGNKRYRSLNFCDIEIIDKYQLSKNNMDNKLIEGGEQNNE